MSTYVAMLRGINVGGARKILMKDLAALYETCGFTGVTTYVQSGNVVFDSKDKSLDKIARTIEDEIDKIYSFHAHVIVRTGADLGKVIAANPFVKKHGIDSKSLYVTFLSGVPDAKNLEPLAQLESGADRFAAVGREIFVLCPGGYGKTKLSNNFFETKLKLAATTRNWKTVTVLHEMAVKNV
jgi:uncharacterized protein (DUF1697 family)